MKFILAFMFLVVSASVQAKNKAHVVKFLLPMVELCNEQLDCQDIVRDNLPDPQQKAIEIVSYDQETGLIKLQLANDYQWIHQTQVELDVKSVATEVCSSQSVARKSDTAVFATMGLGEGC